MRLASSLRSVGDVLLPAHIFLEELLVEGRESRRVNHSDRVVRAPPLSARGCSDKTDLKSLTTSERSLEPAV